MGGKLRGTQGLSPTNLYSTRGVTAWRCKAQNTARRPWNETKIEAGRGPGSGPRPAAAISLQVGDGKWTWGRQIREGGCKLRL